MSLTWIMHCWGGRLWKGTAVLGVCCAWLSSPGNLWVQCPCGGGRGTVLPASSCGRNVEELLWAEVAVELLGLLGSAVPRLWFSTALCAPRSSWCTAPCFPGHAVIPLDFFCRPWRARRLWKSIVQMIQAWLLCFWKESAKERIISCCGRSNLSISATPQNCALTFLSRHLCCPWFASPHNKGHEGAKINGELIQSKLLKFKSLVPLTSWCWEQKSAHAAAREGLGQCSCSKGGRVELPLPGSEVLAEQDPIAELHG